MIQGSENLHSHTRLSDGTITHEETLDVAAANGCSILAFTDHDLPMPLDKYEELKSNDHTTKWISGIELSLADPPGKSKGSYHLIGLFVDPYNAALREHALAMKEARVGKAKRYVEMFRTHGFNITLDDVLARAGDGGNVTKPHAVAALIAHPENVQLLQKHIEDMRVRAARDPEVAAAYEQALERSGRYDIGQFVYPLFLRPSGGVADTRDDVSPDLARGVELIRGAGGVAILAHWHTIKDAITAEILEGLLAGRMLDGAETVWGIVSKGGYEMPDWQESREAMRGMVGRTGALASCSLDAHHKADYELFASREDFARQTVGMTAQILAHSNVSREFSTL